MLFSMDSRLLSGLGSIENRIAKKYGNRRDYLGISVTHGTNNFQPVKSD